MHVSPPDRYSFLSKLSDLARRLCPEKVASRKRLAAFLVSSGRKLVYNVNGSGIQLMEEECLQKRKDGRKQNIKLRR